MKKKLFHVEIIDQDITLTHPNHVTLLPGPLDNYPKERRKRLEDDQHKGEQRSMVYPGPG